MIVELLCAVMVLAAYAGYRTSEWMMIGGGFEQCVSLVNMVFG